VIIIIQMAGQRHFILTTAIMLVVVVVVGLHLSLGLSMAIHLHQRTHQPQSVRIVLAVARLLTQEFCLAHCLQLIGGGDGTHVGQKGLLFLLDGFESAIARIHHNQLHHTSPSIIGFHMTFQQAPKRLLSLLF